MPPFASLLQLIAVSLTAHIALAGARVTTSLYALSLHGSELTIGILIALFSLFPMLFAVPAGRLIDRVGIVRPMLAGSIALAAGCAMPGFISGMEVLYMAAILIGTGFMVIQVAAQHTVGAASLSEQRASHFSWLALGFSVSGFCGPVLAGLLIEHATYSTAYLSFASFALLACALAAHRRIRLFQPAARDEPGSGGSALDLLRNPGLRRIYIVGILLSSAWDLFTFVLPIHGARLGFSASTIGLILGCFSAATFIVRLAMPWISRALTEWQVLIGALMLAALCYMAFPMIRQPSALMLLAAVLGVAVGSSQPNMLALLHHTAPSGREGEAVGVRVTIGNACQVVLPLAFGSAGMAIGLPAVFWAMGLVIGSGVPFALRRPPSK